LTLIAASAVNFTKPSLCGPYARGSDSEWTLYAEGSYDGCTIAPQEQLMPDLIYVGLGVFLFALMSVYARACGRI
jgi:hypothetical protein